MTSISQTEKTTEPSVRDLSPTEGFGALLRAWRLARGQTQEALSIRAGVSQRHLSFLEKSRSIPTRAMVITLAKALDIPLRERNTLLIAAGYAGAYRGEPLQSPVMAPVDAALSQVLDSHDPLPALVIDSNWDVLNTNQGAVRLFGYYLGPDYLYNLPAGQPLNLIEAMCSKDGLSNLVPNWPTIAQNLVERLAHEALGGIVNERTQELIDLLKSTLERDVAHQPGGRQGAGEPLPFLEIELWNGKARTRWFTAIMAFGSPVDITLQDLRVEFMFPVDAESRRFAEQLAIDA